MGQHKGYVPSEETRRKQSESLARAYAEGRMVLTGAALQQSLKPKKSEADRKARKLVTQAAWRERNPKKLAGYKRKYAPQSYGLTAEQYEEPILCDICKRPQQGNCRLAQDHRHGCCPPRTACDKCRRGRLCTNCNTLLGSAHDNPEILQNAILYLKSFEKQTGELPCLTHPQFVGKSQEHSN